MKKYLFFALAAVGMLSSCTSDDIVSDGKKNVDNGELVPIRIGMGQSVGATRGSGTVGGFDDTSDNLWDQQEVRIYMLHRDSMAFAQFDEGTGAAKYNIYNNALFTTPNGVQTGIATPNDHKIEYYPSQGKFDFWGYRLDDAQIVAGPTFDPIDAEDTNNESADSLFVDFKINGSQDVMVAKAVPTTDGPESDIAKLNNSGIEGAANRYYSAFAARWGVQPDLRFRHKLTRLTFEVVPGNMSTVNAESPVIVDSILVTSPVQGRLVIAKRGNETPEQQQVIWWDKENTEEVALMQRAAGATAKDAMVELEDVSLAGKGALADPLDPESDFVPETVSVGEALLLAPEVASYPVKIVLHQPSNRSLDSTDKTDILYTYETEIPAPVADGLFKEGYSYKVQIKLWGLTDIKVTTTLTKWENGEDISIAPEDINE